MQPVQPGLHKRYNKKPDWKLFILRFPETPFNLIRPLTPHTSLRPEDTVSSGDALSFLQPMVVDLISESFRFNFHVNSIHGLCKIIEILTFRSQNFIIPIHNDRRKIFSVLLELFFVVFFMSFILLKTWNNKKIIVGNFTIGMAG